MVVELAAGRLERTRAAPPPEQQHLSIGGAGPLVPGPGRQDGSAEKQLVGPGARAEAELDVHPGPAFLLAQIRLGWDVPPVDTVGTAHAIPPSAR